ncbi:MnhB domain-containing protein [Haloechinothrix salitolerans]|uniref:MnhB domain-containing protein n=1 Tax=Haloechinothrix salitolerans TaxID=926830 RepID=A0ABW2C0I4_9PSEU
MVPKDDPDVPSRVEDRDTPRQPWLLTAEDQPPLRRSVVLEVTARAVFPTVLLLSVYLLFAGHHHLGGGFAGGLVAGLAFVLRYAVAGSAELFAAVRVRPLALTGAGLALTTVSALSPVAFGEPVLASGKVTSHTPWGSEIALNSNLALDIGVYVLILGAVLDLLRTLGAGVRSREGEEE